MQLDERALTAALAGACVAVALVASLPRWLPTRGRLTVERPDLHVSIEGAVAHPGAYVLPFGARVADLVDAAGGLRGSAARALVALAAPVVDGEVVQVPTAATDHGPRRVPLNEASAAELATLPGVGPALAGRIIEGRPYATVDELLRVRGIGEATLARLRPLVGL